jgi:tRNA(fMet)-specific endonuclease VapC
MERALIDTDILSYFLKGDPAVVKNVEDYLEHYNVLEISIITYYEIMSGLLAKNANNQLIVFESFIAENLVVPLSENSVKISSGLYAALRQSGNTVDDIDLLIAGIAIENGMILITNNNRHFGRIHGLKTGNWKEII